MQMGMGGGGATQDIHAASPVQLIVEVIAQVYATLQHLNDHSLDVESELQVLSLLLV